MAWNPWRKVVATFKQYTELLVAASSGATYTVDLSKGNVHDITLTANCTLQFVNAPLNEVTSFTLLLRQDATGSRTVTWPSSIKWPGGTAPTLSTAANAVDVLTFFTVDGATWYGFLSGANMS